MAINISIEVFGLVKFDCLHRDSTLSCLNTYLSPRKAGQLFSRLRSVHLFGGLSGFLHMIASNFLPTFEIVRGGQCIGTLSHGKGHDPLGTPYM